MKVRFLRESEMETYSAPPGLSGIYVGPGENARMGKFVFDKGKIVGNHKHENSEQLSYVLKGELKVIVNGEERIVGKGESYLIPAGVEHSLEALKDTVSMDVWAPPG